MILSDATIKDYIEKGKIVILPDFNFSDIRPAGIRLHMGNEIMMPAENQTIDPSDPNELIFVNKSLESGFLFKPGMFILGTTKELIKTSRDLICHIDGRSTIARLGIAIHCTSGMIDGNYEEPRSVVLEIKNQGPLNVILRPEMPVALLTFSQLTGEIEQNLQDQYKGQTSVAGPNMNFRIKK